MTILALIFADTLKNGPVGRPSLHFFDERCLALLLVTAAVILYLRSDRSEVASAEAERISIFEQQGGNPDCSKESGGYAGDWEWDTADEDDEALKHLLIREEEDQSLGFIIDDQHQLVNSGSGQMIMV